MHILIADKLTSSVEKKLVEMGAKVTYDPTLKDERLSDAIKKAEPNVLVVRSTKINSDHLRASQRLSLVVRAGAGTNTIDVKTASKLGIYVSNCPGKNAIAVAELTLGHLINMDRRISDNVSDLRNGQWKKKEYSVAKGLFGRTLAVVGLGAIGREVVKRALSFGMNVKGYDLFLTDEMAIDLGIVRCDSPLSACEGADAVTVHLPLNESTRGIISTAELNALKDCAYVINTSRGGIVDEAALKSSIESKNLRAGLDVFENEPGANEKVFSNAIGKNANVYGTHHIGASTDQASEAVGNAVVDTIQKWQQNGKPNNCVNLSRNTSADHLLIIRHADKVGVLAGILNLLRTDRHNIQEMENIIFDGGEAACVRIQMVGHPSPELIDTLSKNIDVFSIAVSKL